ncbi:MAG TPA: YncE family protein [Geothrix sp.]|nr:YncE family protein [Geothrix sp.]
MPLLGSSLLALGLLGQAGSTPSAPSAPAPAAQQASTWSLLRSLPVGGEGGWDYVTLDPEAERLYVPRSTHVMVLDLEGKPMGDIPATSGVHGVALAPELDRGFTSNGRSNTMTVFKRSTLAVIQEVKTTGENPDAILYEPATRQIFTFNGRGKNATVFNAETLQVVGTIPIGGKPEFSACDGKGHIFVNVEDTHELLTIDAIKRAVTARWSLKPLEEPTGLAIDAARQRLFAVGGNKLMAVVDIPSGKLIATLPIGAGCDGVVFDPGTGCAYAANGEGTITIIRADGLKTPFTVEATVPTRKGARTLAVDPKTHLLYLPTAAFASAPAAKAGERSRPTMVPGSFQMLVVGTAR